MTDQKSDDDNDEHDGCFAEKSAKAKHRAHAKRAQVVDRDDDDDNSDDEVYVVDDSASTNSTITSHDEAKAFKLTTPAPHNFHTG